MKPTPPAINPTRRTFTPPEPELSHKAARNIVRVFLIILLIPLLFETLVWISVAKTNLAVAAVRSGMQWFLTHALTEGNRGVFLGRDGWLFDQRSLDRLVHARRDENGMQASLLQLAAKLKSQDTPLLVITIPERAALYPEQIRAGQYKDVVRLKDEASTLAKLQAAGIEVLDMTPALWVFRERELAFFARDSHWTPEAMKAVALLVNKHIRDKFRGLGSNETPIINATILEHADAGDLTRRLDPWHPENLLGEEAADLISIQGITPSAKSPIVLHGGELMRVFDEPNLSFGGGGSAPNAGFATQLSTLMGRPLDVRDMPKPGEDYADKKLVILLLPMAELVP